VVKRARKNLYQHTMMSHTDIVRVSLLSKSSYILIKIRKQWKQLKKQRQFIINVDLNWRERNWQ
jgi:hypothetical protein